MDGFNIHHAAALSIFGDIPPSASSNGAGSRPARTQAAITRSAIRGGRGSGQLLIAPREHPMARAIFAYAPNISITFSLRMLEVYSSKLLCQSHYT